MSESITIRPYILVLGATGTVGSKVIASLAALNNNQYAVRAATRDPNSAQAQQLLQQYNTSSNPLEFIQWNPSDSTALANAVAGVTRIFILTTNNPGDPDMVEHLLEAAQPHAELVIYMSADGIDSSPEWPQLAVEAATSNMSIPFIILRPTTFMDNFINPHTTLFNISNNGLLQLTTGDGKIAHIDTRDIGDTAAKLLLSSREQLSPYIGHTYVMSGPQPLTCTEICALITQRTNKNIIFQHISEDDYRQLLRQRSNNTMTDENVELWVVLARFFANNGRAKVAAEIQRLVGVQLRTWDDFLQTKADKIKQLVP